METAENRLVEAEDSALEESMDERDTYYEFKAAVKVAAWARGISAAALVVGFLKGFIIAYRYFTTDPVSAPRTAEIIIQVLTETGYWMVLGAVAFILLQAIAQGIFLLMDLEENSRK